MSKSSIGWRKAGISSLATAALVAGACVAGAGAASANTGFSFTRVNGTDRYGTSAAVAKEFGSATDVILASGLPGHYPDALAANYLAGIKKAPVLLTKMDSTPPSVLQAIKDSGAKDVWIVGGTGVISQAQQDELAKTYTVHRIAGSDRFETATDVINQGGTSSGEGIVATGLNFPDALGAGPLAYAKDMPLAISRTKSISQDEIDALKAAGVTKVLIIGGTNAVSNAVEAQLVANGITVDKRLSGTDRAGTAAAVADYELNHGFTDTAVNVASGFTQGDGADALGGGALSGENTTPMLITNSDVHAGAATLAYLTDHANTLAKGDLFGGTAAISKDVQDAMEAAAQAVTSNQTYTVTPQSAQSTDQGKSIQYSASGLADGTTYTVELFSCDNVSTGADGQTTFTQTVEPTSTTPGSGQAAQGDTAQTSVSVVNGQVVTAGAGNNQGTRVTAQPVNGVVSFTVLDSDSGSAPICVVPVLYNDSTTSGTPGVLDVNKTTGAPTEAFGTGGSATFNAPAAVSNYYSGVQVLSVDKSAGTFLGDTNGTSTTGGVMTFTYTASGDTYYYLNGRRLSASQFADYLSGKVAKGSAAGTSVNGDTVDVNYNASGPSDFTMDTDVPAAPTGTSATFQPAVTGGTAPHTDQVDVKWTAPSNPNVESYNVYRAQVDNKGNVGPYTLIGNTDTGAASTYNGSIPTGNTATDTEYVDPDVTPGTTYSYEVTAVAGDPFNDVYTSGSLTTDATVEGPVSNAAQATDPAPATPTYTAPKITSVTITKSDNTTSPVTAGTATVTYDEAVTCLSNAGQDFTYSNTGGSGAVTGAQCALGAPSAAWTAAGNTGTDTLTITFPTTTGGTTPSAITVAAPGTGDTFSYTAPATETTSNSVFAGPVTAPAYENNQTVTDTSASDSPLK